MSEQFINFKCILNPRAPVAQKIADEMVFRRFQGEGVEFFFKSDLIDPPPQIFEAHLLEITDLSSSRFNFSVDFISKSCCSVSWFYSLFERMRLERKRTMFINTNQPLITSFYIKRYLFFCRISDESALIRTFCPTGA